MKELNEQEIKHEMSLNKERIITERVCEHGRYLVTCKLEEEEPIYIVYRSGVDFLEKLETFKDIKICGNTETPIVAANRHIDKIEASYL